MIYKRKELDGPLREQGPKTIGGGTRTCGRCSGRKSASGAGGKVVRLFGWICAECAERGGK